MRLARVGEAWSPATPGSGRRHSPAGFENIREFPEEVVQSPFLPWVLSPETSVLSPALPLTPWDTRDTGQIPPLFSFLI